MKTLVIVDAQNDFMPGGSLEVADGDKIIPIINDLIPKFDLVIGTQDWHPKSHKSFAANHKDKELFQEIEWKGIKQTLWPIHCVQNSRGAEIHKNIKSENMEAIFRKGTDINIDSYSAFYDNGHKKATGLTGYLKEKKAKDLYFTGLAADVCVYFTMKDAVNEGFKVNLIIEGTKALDDKTFKNQLEELKEKGVKVVSADNL
jgi:nicotinamidase/pyrazinamidase